MDAADDADDDRWRGFDREFGWGTSRKPLLEREELRLLLSRDMVGDKDESNEVDDVLDVVGTSVCLYTRKRGIKLLSQ
jgi:hypothetical protein